MPSRPRKEHEPTLQHDISRVLMAISQLLHTWDNEMKIPDQFRPFLVERDENRHWKTDARGYPVPSRELIELCERLRESDERKGMRTSYSRASTRQSKSAGRLGDRKRRS